jgi:hypothetical protein
MAGGPLLRDGWEARKLGIHKIIIHGVGFFDLIILWQEGQSW